MDIKRFTQTQAALIIRQMDIKHYFIILVTSIQPMEAMHSIQIQPAVIIQPMEIKRYIIILLVPPIRQMGSSRLLIILQEVITQPMDMAHYFLTLLDMAIPQMDIKRFTQTQPVLEILQMATLLYIQIEPVFTM